MNSARQAPESLNRRRFLGLTGTAALATGATLAAQTPGGDRPVRIVGVACSPRPGRSTATGVQVALEAARGVNPRIEIELIDLGGLTLSGWTGGARPGEAQAVQDDFERIRPKLEHFHGLIIGSPSYYRSMSALCKAFLERCSVFQAPKLVWSDRPVGVLAVGAFRNGGQELVIQQIQTALLCFDMMIVGGKPRAHQGATLWNPTDGDITQDAFGIDTAQKLGQRVAEAALKLAG